jgi:hypothetical protein
MRVDEARNGSLARGVDRMGGRLRGKPLRVVLLCADERESAAFRPDRGVSNSTNLALFVAAAGPYAQRRRETGGVTDFEGNGDERWIPHRSLGGRPRGTPHERKRASARFVGEGSPPPASSARSPPCPLFRVRYDGLSSRLPRGQVEDSLEELDHLLRLQPGS